MAEVHASRLLGVVVGQPKGFSPRRRLWQEDSFGQREVVSCCFFADVTSLYPAWPRFLSWTSDSTILKAMVDCVTICGLMATSRTSRALAWSLLARNLGAAEVVRGAVRRSSRTAAARNRK